MVSTKETRSFERAFKTMESRNWDCIYVVVDLHSTVVKSNWSDSELPDQVYPFALETLKLLTQNPKVKLILWTSSWERDYIQYQAMLGLCGINFDFVNENPDEKSNPEGYTCFEKKFYFNVLLDDKAGFEADVDWEPLRDFIKGLNP